MVSHLPPQNPAFDAGKLDPGVKVVVKDDDLQAHAHAGPGEVYGITFFSHAQFYLHSVPVLAHHVFNAKRIRHFIA